VIFHGYRLSLPFKHLFMSCLRFALLFFVISIVSCEGPAGLTSLIEISDEPAGSQCSAGGLRITTGIDSNENGVLDNNEVTLTKFTCNGTNGISTLLITTTEPKSANCANGGIKVQVGKDTNSDSQLDASEVEQIRYVCDGNNGISSLVVLTNLGPSDSCPAGGVRMQSGLDINTNGQLDESEIIQTKEICNGANRSTELRFEAGGISGFFNTPGGPHDSTNPSIISLFDDLNLENYDGYDSIVYVVKPVRVHAITGGPTVFDKNIILEVVNESNGNAVISGSRLTVTSGDEYVSENFASAIPSGTIDLGFSLKSTDANYYGQISKVTLVMISKH
jgi:hypothetical protein